MIADPAEILSYPELGGSATDADLVLLNMLQPMVERAIQDHLQQDVEYAQHVEYLPPTYRGVEQHGLERIELNGNKVVSSFDNRSQADEILQLKHLPVWLNAGTNDEIEVREDSNARAGQASGSFGNETILALGTQYFLDLEEERGATSISETGHLYRIGSWSWSPRSVKITYYGGYTRADLDSGSAMSIKYATILTTVKAIKQAIAMRGRKPGPLTSESIGHWSGSRDPETVRQIAGMSITIPHEAKQMLQPFTSYGRLFA